jgi:Holliday junction resolvase RusA-like endonuclease
MGEFVDRLSFVVPGKPMGWQRTRVSFKQRRHFNDPKTETAEAAVVIAWIDAGSPRLPDEALAVYVEAVLERPATHWKKSGDLSAAGERTPWPTKKPDDDNVCKLVRDALNTRAYRDDALIVHGTQVKRWAHPGEGAHTRVHIQTMVAWLADRATGVSLPPVRVAA